MACVSWPTARPWPGSVATMDRLIRTMVQKAEIPLEDAVRMASETPARIMGVSDRKGTLQRGKDADIVLLDRDLNVRAVWGDGVSWLKVRINYSKQERLC